MTSMKYRLAWIMALVTMLASIGMGATPAVTALTSTGSLTAAYSSACATTTCVVVPMNSAVNSETWQITGTFSGTVTFEGTVDGTNWVATAVIPVGSTRTLTTTATAAGIWVQSTVGLTAVRARCSAYTSGTIVVTGKRSGAVPPAQ